MVGISNHRCLMEIRTCVFRWRWLIDMLQNSTQHLTCFTSCYPHHAFLWLLWPTIQLELGNNRMFGDNLWDSWWLAGYKNWPWKRLGYINLSLPRLQSLDNSPSSSFWSTTNLWKILLNCQHVNYCFYTYAFSFWICLSCEWATLPFSFSILA